MDPRLLQQKRSAYQSRTVRLDQSIFQRIGLIKSRVHLKIADYYISCVPYDLSLETCRAIAVLGPREIAFFGEYREGTHNLHLKKEKKKEKKKQKKEQRKKKKRIKKR